MKKPRYVAWIELTALVTIGALAPLTEMLTTDAGWSQLGSSPVPLFAALIGGANAAKAFFSSGANSFNGE